MIFRGCPNSRREVNQDLQTYSFYRDELTIENRILLKGD